MAETRPAAGSPIRFGVFELDPRSGELKKAGILLHLPPQPTRVLAMLASHAGEIITRDQIREQLWDEDTHVDFDQGLNQCIAQIRTVLSDDADTPRYVQTLPRRGYRFVAAVAPAGATESAADGPGEQGVDPPRNVRLWVGLAAGLAIGLLSVVLFGLRDKPGEPPLRRFTITPAQQLHITSFNTDVVISPDGRKIAYRGDGALWIHDLSQERVRRVPGAVEINEPFWAPDSQRVGFHQDNQLMTVAVDGGLPARVCHLKSEFWSGSWSPDGEVIVFAMGARPKLYQVPARGGEPQLLFDPPMGISAPDEPAGAVYTVRFVPAGRDSRIILFAAGAQDDPRLYMQDLKSGRRGNLGAGTLPQYSPTGHIVYQESSLSYSLWAAPFSLEQFAITGAPFQLAAHGRDPTLAWDGTLVYVDAQFPGWRLTWRDRTGKSHTAPGEPLGVMQAPELSPDQRYAGVSGGRDSNFNDLWVHDLTKGTRVRLTHAEKELESYFGPSWSPDGSRIAYALLNGGIFTRRPDGPGESEALLLTRNFVRNVDWSREGRRIVYSVRNPGTGYDVFWLEQNEAGGEWTAQPFLAGPANEDEPRLSPDGRYVAYQSNVTGRTEVYVRSFPDGKREWAVSSRSGRSPRWRRDGMELFYIDGSNAMIAVPVRLGDEFAAGQEQRLFEAPEGGLVPSVNYPYDVAADGQRFLLAEPVGRIAPPRIRVVQSWHAEFRHRR